MQPSAHLLEAKSIVCISTWFNTFCASYLKREKNRFCSRLLSSRNLTLINIDFFQCFELTRRKKVRNENAEVFFVTFRVFRRMKCKCSVKSHLSPTCVKSYSIFALFYRLLVQTDTKFRNIHPPTVFAFCRESELFCNWN